MPFDCDSILTHPHTPSLPQIRQPQCQDPCVVGDCAQIDSAPQTHRCCCWQRVSEQEHQHLPDLWCKFIASWSHSGADQVACGSRACVYDRRASVGYCNWHYNCCIACNYCTSFLTSFPIEQVALIPNLVAATSTWCVILCVCVCVCLFV